jgi:hypothetical protein
MAGLRPRPPSTSTWPEAVHNRMATLESLEKNYARTKERRSRDSAEERIRILEVLRVEAFGEAGVDG